MLASCSHHAAVCVCANECDKATGMFASDGLTNIENIVSYILELRK